MKKQNKPDNKKNRYSYDSRDLTDLGLEPPKIYRDSQKSREIRYSQKDNLTRGEKRTKQTKRRKKRNKFRKFIIWCAAILFFLALGVILSLTVFFDINVIEVLGTNIYTAQEVKTACPVSIGDNLFLADTKKASQMIETNLPYVYNARLIRKPPETLMIEITEAKPAYSIKMAEKSYILLDDNFKVLDNSAQKGAGIRVDNKDIKYSENGKTVVFKKDNTGKCLTQIAQTIKNNSFTEITAIRSESLTNNFVEYKGKITFKLGNCDNLDTKIYKALAACEKLDESNPESKGTITVTDGKSIYFTEE